MRALCEADSRTVFGPCMITITLRNFRSSHSVGCTECGERKFLSVIVIMQGPNAVLLHKMTPLAGTPSASWWQDFFDARQFTSASTDTVPDAQAAGSSLSHPARLAPLAQATCGLGRPCKRATADFFSTICNADVHISFDMGVGDWTDRSAHT